MDDKALQRLVRMAVEAEQFEAGEKLRLAGTPRETRPIITSGRRWRGLGALAACVGLLAGVITLPRMITAISGTGGPKGPIADGGVAPRPRAIVGVFDEQAQKALDIFRSINGHSNGKQMLLALFRDGQDGCECVVWKEAEFGDRNLDEVSRSELLAAAMKGRCSADSSLVLVLALDGPQELLPESTEAAASLAACVSNEIECRQNAACYTTQAIQCLPEQVSVVAETLAMQ